ncbi:MAG: Asp-tRNA(Asn)/Glu-tRNA(Gln) amidotransferase subunit GatC [Candidatus Acidiferrales bacterium]
MKITSQDVLRVAELAHLELSPAEIETYRGQLDEILTYIGKLNELDVSAVEPMAQVTFAAVDSRPPELRDDVVRDCHTADAIFPIAPDAARPFFRVPKVIEK